MKKLIALFLLSLICLTTFSGAAKLCDTGYELVKEVDGAEKEKKEDKKDLKEFMAHAIKVGSFCTTLLCRFNMHEAYILPQPVIDKPTPPPNAAG